MKTVLVKTTGAPFEAIYRNSDACRSCWMPVWWVKTPNGKNMPVDPPADGELAVPHWATCPQRKEWRGKTRKTFAGGTLTQRGGE